MTGMESPQSVSAVLYYRGVSITITKRDGETKIKPLVESQLQLIDWMIDEKACMPSWNPDTNKAALGTTVATPLPLAVTNGAEATTSPVAAILCATCKAPATHKTGIGKTGKPWSAIFCSLDKKHVTWL